jgi:alkylated DNA repair dioxygenase AlkB
MAERSSLNPGGKPSVSVPVKRLAFDPGLLWQPSLFDPPRSDAAEGPPPSSARRSLDADSWIEVIPDWLPDPAPLLSCLLESAPWRQRDRWMVDHLVTEPRLTAEYHDLSDVPHPALREAAEELSRVYGVRYDHLWLNLYRDGRDSTAWHRDRFSCRRPVCTVPVLSLGVTRRFLLRRRKGGPSVPFLPSSGTLVVMGGRCQQDWVHSVPKSAGVAGARISINFQSTEQAGGDPRRGAPPAPSSRSIALR